MSSTAAGRRAGSPIMGDPGERGRFGEFGGLFVPETLVPACQELEAAFREAAHEGRLPCSEIP